MYLQSTQNNTSKEFSEFQTKLNSSDPFLRLWNDACKAVIQKEVRLGSSICQTRWCYVINLFSKFYSFRTVFSRMSEMASNYYKGKYQEDVLFLLPRDWIFIHSVVELMQPASDCIKKLEGDKYPTHSSILILLHITIEHVKKFPVGNSSRLKTLVSSLKKELIELWNELPLETLISTALDPRLKSLNFLTKAEQKETWVSLGKEFKKFKDSRLEPEADAQILEKTPETVDLTKKKRTAFEAFLSDRDQKKRQKIQDGESDEMSRYRALDEELWDTNPLIWWKNKEKELPVFSQMAKAYLAIPASQATTERTFSKGSKILLSTRHSMSPSVISSLMFGNSNKQHL